MKIQLLPAGSDAVLVEAGGPAEARAVYAALAAARSAGALAGVEELVPAARTVLVVAEPGPAGRRALASLGDALRDAPAAASRPADAPADTDRPVVELPVVYDGADLDAVVGFTGLPAAEVARRHAAAGYTVAFCGFAPGFAYLVGLPEELRVPRRDSARTRVPAGAVGLAGEYTGAYPTASPGGWQLIGRTDAVLWDPDREPAALLAPGTRVRFHPVPAHDLRDPSRATRAASRSGPPPAVAVLSVRRAGALTTVQDLGRPGHAHVGVPHSGAADAASLRLANRLVGNAEDAAALETTLTGVEVALTAARVVAVTGAPAVVRVTARGGDAEGAMNAPVFVPAGGVVAVGPARAGLRTYLAVGGGLDVPAVLGSRSTDVLSGLGPPPLADGVALPLGAPPPAPAGEEVAPVADVESEPVLRLVLGPRADWFTDVARALIGSAAWSVSPRSNRVGARLDGPALARARGGELPSEGVVLGAVQVPPDGRPVVFLADHPTTGGYPVIGVVHAEDVRLVAQARPGATLRFRVVG